MMFMMFMMFMMTMVIYVYDVYDDNVFSKTLLRLVKLLYVLDRLVNISLTS